MDHGHNSPQAASGGVMRLANTKPTFIAVVHSEVDQRIQAAEALMEDGYRVVVAATSDQALAVVQARWETRLVVTDVGISGSVDGYGLARILDLRWPGIGVIVAGPNLPSDKDMPPRARFLQKPYASASLIRLIHEVLGETPEPLPGSRY